MATNSYYRSREGSKGAERIALQEAKEAQEVKEVENVELSKSSRSGLSDESDEDSMTLDIWD
jgi:hypothetical protein